MHNSPEVGNSSGPQTKETFFSPLFKVTTVSKYLALLIFILTPFFAGYIGFELGLQQNPPQTYNVYTEPAKTVSIETKSPEPTVVTNKKPESLPDAVPEFVIKNTAKYSDTYPEQNILVSGKVILTSAGCSLQEGNHIQESYLLASKEVKGLSNSIPDVLQVVGSVNCWFAGGGNELFMYKNKESDGAVHVVGYETGECGTLSASECSAYGKVESLY